MNFDDNEKLELAHNAVLRALTVIDDNTNDDPLLDLSYKMVCVECTLEYLDKVLHDILFKEA